MIYFVIFSITFFLAVFFTLAVKKIAVFYQIVDKPNLPRKVHKQPIPLLGGLAVFASFILVLIFCSLYTDLIIKDFILSKYVVAIISASLILMLGGILDDKYNLAPKYQFIFPVLAVLLIVISGIGITHIRNPFGGTLRFDQWNMVLFSWQGLPYKFTILADVFTFIWLIGMTYTTKLLDGLDGLVSGVTVVGSFIIFLIAFSNNVKQYNTGLLALILGAAFLGFLIFNWHPAKIFLGEGGSLWAGFMLGVLAIISGSKVATTLLIMGLPILDVIWVIARRLKLGKNPFKYSDRQHLHFRLLDAGLSHQQAVIFYIFLTFVFGICAVFLQTLGKLIAFLSLLVVMIILAIVLVIFYKKKNSANKGASV